MPQVKREKTPEQALASLMRLASRAEKSSGDAMRLMHGWGIVPDQRTGILARLIATGFIDDERYAAAYVREKMRLSGWGIHKIRAALAAKGIAREVIDRTTETLADGEMNDRLEKHLNRKRTSIKAETHYELRSKLIRYGMSLGHEYEKVAEAVERILKTE